MLKHVSGLGLRVLRFMVLGVWVLGFSVEGPAGHGGHVAPLRDPNILLFLGYN